MCFKSLRDEAPVASWRNRLYGCILVTQRSRCTLWNRRRGAVCRVFQKSSWRSSRRFEEKWVVWTYIGDAQEAQLETDGAALCAVCFKTVRDEAPVVSWRNGLYGCILVTQRSTCTFWNRRRGVVCREFQRSSWRSSRRASWRNGLYGFILVTQRSTCTFWNRRRGAVCRVFQKFSWRSSRRFVEKWVVWMYIKDAALQRHNLKQTARRCVPCVSKVFVTKLPSLRGEFDYMAPVASWRNGLYGCILRTQRSRGTIWNRRRGAVCRVFQKSSWQSSRRFVENLTIWMYIGDTALRWTFWIRWRRAACCVFQKSTWQSSRRFVEKWSIWVYIGDAALRCAFWNRRPDTVCCMFQNSSWRSSRRFVEKWSIWVYIGDAALSCIFLNRRRDTACCMFQNPSWRSYQRFVDEVPHISRSDGIIKVLKRLAIWWILGVAVCFKTAST